MSSLAGMIRESSWAYPVLQIVHILGIVFLAGAAVLFDLRIVGISRQVPVQILALYLLPWSRKGLFLIIPSGALLFITEAKTFGTDPVFYTKMILLLLAATNATLFNRYLSINSEERNKTALAKAAGVASIILWVAVISCGRLLAY